MAANEVSPTEYVHRCCRISLQDFLKICTTALVPLMIGVMTLVITIHQHKQGNENRLNDLQIAKELREQQLQLEEARRKQDGELEDTRRNQDRILDNQRRQQDRELDEEHRRQNLEIAQATRQDLILSTYFNEMSHLLIEFNFKLNERVRLVIVRPKTLTALQQLEPKRKTLLVEFLYESNFIRGQHSNFDPSSINMIEANLNDIDLTHNYLGRRTLSYLSLSGAQLINASFQNCNMNISNFEKALMKGVSFNGAHIGQTNFFRTSLVNTDFTNAIVGQADFTLADLTGSNITHEQLLTAETYNRAILTNGTIALYANFIRNGDASDCTLEHWNIGIKDTIQIIHKDNKCMFQANISTGDVTMSQKITSDKIRTYVEKEFYYIDVQINIQKIFPSNSSSFVKLTKLFYNENDFAIGQSRNIFFYIYKSFSFISGEKDIDTTLLTMNEVHKTNWITDDWGYLRDAHSIELFIIFHHSLICNNIGLFFEQKRIFDEED
jgi:uncharacterized protein YjbI with pentapeptide repeats